MIRSCHAKSGSCGYTTDVWHDHYKKLSNSVNDTDDQTYVLRYIRNNLDTTYAVVIVDMICATKELINNKSPRYEGLISEHFKYALHRLYILMAIVLQSMVNNGFLPQQFMTTMLAQILKIRMATLQTNQIISRLLCLQWHIYIKAVCLQKVASTDMCILTLKWCIRYYAVHSTPMSVCFIRASKALDCVNLLLIENALVILSKCYFPGIRNSVCVSNGMVWLLIYFLYVWCKTVSQIIWHICRCFKSTNEQSCCGMLHESISH